MSARELHPHSTRPYATIARLGKPVAQRLRIIDELETQQVPLNRRQIAELTRIPINVVCWRVKGMLDSCILRVAHNGKDPITGQDTEYLEPADAGPIQREFGW